MLKMRRFYFKKKNDRQRGFMLMEAMLAISIAIAILASGAFYSIQEFKKEAAASYGRKIAQYTAAVRASLVLDGAGVLAGGSPRFGVAWLKQGATCPGGTATEPFLACPFQPTLGYGTNLDALGTTIASNGVASPTYSGVIVFPGVTESDGTVRTDLTGLAAQAAERYDNYDRASFFAGGTMAYQYFRVAGNYIDPATGTNVPVAANTIVAMAVADADDIFLRRDGSNSMLGSLNMNSNDIINSRHYTGTGTVSAVDLVASGAAHIGGDTVIQGNVGIQGDAYLGKSISVQGDVGVTGSAFVGADVSAGGDLGVNGSAWMRNVSVANLTATGSADIHQRIVNTSGSNGGAVLIDDAATIPSNLTVGGKMDLTNPTTVHTVANIVRSKDVELTGVTLGGGNTPLSGAIVYSGVFANGSVVQKPACNSGSTDTPQIFVTPAVVHANGNGLNSVLGYASDNGTSWTIKIESKDPTNVTITNGLRAAVFIKCS